MKFALAVVAAATAVTLALPAAAQPPSGKSGAENSCFWIRDLRNHTVGGDHTLYFDVNGRSVYKVETTGACLAGATSSDPIVLRQRTGSGQICSAIDLDLSIRGSRCIVSGMTRLTPEEAAALPRRMHP
jgi:hypothetical protein